jgi:hypothetical protein
MILNSDKILKIFDDGQKTGTPVTIVVDEVEAKICVLKFDKVTALGKQGGVVSFYFEEEDD